MEYTETEKKYLEDDTTSPSNAMLYREIKALRSDLAEVRANTGGERVTKESILAIKDFKERQKAINDNMDLFADMFCSGRYTAEELKGGKR